MQMGEASEHRPGDYGRWESSLWSPWHRGSHFGGLVVVELGEGGGGVEGGVVEDEGGGEGREERVMVSFPHMRHRLTPTHHPKKGRNKSISKVRGFGVIY